MFAFHGLEGGRGHGQFTYINFFLVRLPLYFIIQMYKNQTEVAVKIQLDIDLWLDLPSENNIQFHQ